MIKGLSSKVDIIFEPDAEHFLLSLPWSQASKNFLGCYGMVGIKREWLPGFRAYRVDSKDFDDVMELLPDFFATPEIPDFFGESI